MGMTGTVMARVQDSRMIDLGKRVDYNWIMVYFNITGKTHSSASNLDVESQLLTIIL